MGTGRGVKIHYRIPRSSILRPMFCGVRAASSASSTEDLAQVTCEKCLAKLASGSVALPPERPHIDEVVVKFQRSGSDIWEYFPEGTDPAGALVLSEEDAKTTVRGLRAEGMQAKAIRRKHYTRNGYSPFHDNLQGGRAEGMSPRDFDPEQLAIGTEHELEHTNDPRIAEEIAMDHLVEDAAYYEKLNAMERGTFRDNARGGPKQQIVLAWTEESVEVVRARRSDLGESPITKPVLIPQAAMWKRSGTAKDVAKAEAYAATQGFGYRVFAYPSNEKDPIGRARQDILREFQLPNARQPVHTGLAPNGGHYVWVLDSHGTPMSTDGVLGPYALQSAKTFARIAATNGKHDRAVSRGRDPKAPSFEIVRHYRAGTGERLI